MYGNIGYTRRDKTPPHWRDDYHLRATAKKMIQGIKAEREQYFRAFEALPFDISDDDFTTAERELTAILNALIDREDTIRRTNPA